MYMLAATTETPASGLTAKVKVDRVEEAVCDPCVLGTWSLDLRSFENMIKSAMGGALPAGSDFAISGGAYYVAFDDEGNLQEQRDNLTITSSSGGFTLDIVINSFGTGVYTADGENMGVTDLVDLFVDVDVGGFGGSSDSSDTQAIVGSGTYICTTDDMTITIPEGTVRWVRVDRILQPPVIPDS